MGHHASDLPFQDFNDDEARRQFNKLAEELNVKKQPKNPLDLGPTGTYPDGKIADNDEGAIQYGITTMNNRIVFDFGKPIRTIGLTQKQAWEMAEVLTRRANQLDPENGKG